MLKCWWLSEPSNLKKYILYLEQKTPVEHEDLVESGQKNFTHMVYTKDEQITNCTEGNCFICVYTRVHMEVFVSMYLDAIVHTADVQKAEVEIISSSSLIIDRSFWFVISAITNPNF